MIESIRAAYDLIDQMNLTMTGLIAIVAVLALAFLFAVREAASWFFKVDDIKRDVRKVQSLVLELEGQVRVMQELLSQAKKMVSTEQAVEEEAKLVQVRPAQKASGEAPVRSFPLDH